MKPKLLSKKFIIFATAFLLIGIGVILTISCFVNRGSENYVKGEIIVGFKEKITKDEAMELINSYNLEVDGSLNNIPFEIKNSCILRFGLQNIDCDFNTWDDDSKNCVSAYNLLGDQLDASPLISSQKELPCDISGKDYCYSVSLIDDATQDDVDELIDETENVSVVSCSFAGGDNYWGVVKVPKGKEMKWISEFTENDIVEYAEPNYLYELEQGGFSDGILD